MPLLPSEYLARVRSGAIGLGAVPADSKPFSATADQNEVWQAFLNTTADQIELANGEALHWYNTMRGQLEQMDLPLYAQAAVKYGMPTQWTKELDQKLLDVSTMAENVVRWCREAARGERTLAVQGDVWGIVSKPEDEFHIVLDENAPNPAAALVMMGGPAGATPIHATGALGAAPLIVGGVAIPWVIVGAAMLSFYAVIGLAIYAIYTALVALREIATGIIQYWTQKTWSQCVQTAKNPEDCHKAIAGIANLQEKINEGKPKGLSDDAKAVGDMAVKLLWVAFGGAVIYLGIKYVPPLLEDMSNEKKAKKKGDAGALAAFASP